MEGRRGEREREGEKEKEFIYRLHQAQISWVDKFESSNKGNESRHTTSRKCPAKWAQDQESRAEFKGKGTVEKIFSVSS